MATGGGGGDGANQGDELEDYWSEIVDIEQGKAQAAAQAAAQGDLGHSDDELNKTPDGK